MLNKLVERWRPEFFRDVIGQEDVVEWCRGQILSDRPQSVVFHGPTGCGKNTLARVFARAAACDRPTAHGEPCGGCQACKTTLDVTEGYFYSEVPSGKASLSEIKNNVDWLRSGTLGTGRRKILVFDEAQGLKGLKSEILYPFLERKDPKYLIILLTTDLGELIEPLRDRLTKQEVLRPSAEQLRMRGQVVCAAEGIHYETAAIDLLAEVSAGYRAFLQHIDEIAGDSRRLTEHSVRNRYFEHFGALALLRSLLGRNLGEAHHVIARQTRPPAAVHEVARNILVAAQFNIRNCTLYDNSEAKISAAALSSLLEAGEKAAAQIGLSRCQFWDALVAFWTRSPCRSKTDLKSLALEIVGWLHEQPRRRRQKRRSQQTISLARQEPSSVRPHRLPRSALDDGYMALKEAKRIWNAGAVLGQVYGTYINARIVFKPALAGFNDRRRSFEFFANVVRNLRGRVEEWSGTQLHYLYSQSGIDTNELYLLALCLPAGTATQCEVWLGDFLERYGIPTGAITFRTVHFGDIRDRSRYHTCLLRLLCRAIDPSIRVRHRLLIDEIGVPDTIRKTAAGQYVTPKVSQTIGRSAIRYECTRGLPLLLPADDGAWGYRNWGWELAEYEDRKSQMIAASRVDAKRRKRSWTTPSNPGWWQLAYRPTSD